MEGNIESDMDVSKQSGKVLHSRKRKKQHYNRIRQQMEFYFGDANLSKDRFLNKLLAANPYVPLDVFMNFNKIKELANSFEELQNAVEGSEMLELSSDRQSVRRTTEIKKKDDIDEYMIYVEALPPNATHESIKQQFSQFGNVAYVSLPKYRSSGRIKEFAFIEFEDKSSVEKCIDTFKQFGNVIGHTEDVENLTSITSYVKEQEDLENAEEKQSELKENEGEEKKSDENETAVEQNVENNEENEIKADERQNTGTKRTKKISCGDSGEAPPIKRAKVNEAEFSVEESKADSMADEGGKDDGAETEEEQDQQKDANDQPKNKRRRRRNKKHSYSGVKNDDTFATSFNAPDETKTAEDPTQSLSNLRVTTKIVWRKLRNKYLNLQRVKYKEVKKLLQQGKKSEQRKVSTLPQQTIRPVTMKNKKSPPTSKKICTRNINFYGAIRDENNTNTYECSIVDENMSNSETANENQINKEKTSAKDLQFEFEPGLIVKVNFDAPCTDTTNFKGEMKQYPFVRYVDVKEGQMFAHVRVDVPRSAPILIKHCAPKRCQILTDDSETEYWAKIAKDREEKLSKQIKVPKARGRRMRNLIKNIAEVNVITTLDNKTTISHIRFDE